MVLAEDVPQAIDLQSRWHKICYMCMGSMKREQKYQEMNLNAAHIAAYLRQRLGAAVQVLALTPLGAAEESAAADDNPGSVKSHGYGQPLLVHYRVGDEERQAVLRTMQADHFGHEQRSDRAASLLLSYDTFNALPRHVQALDVGVLLPDGRPQSLGEGDEFFLLTDYVTGQLYAQDMQRLRDTGQCSELDLRRARRLAEYLAEIHAVRRDDPARYLRHLRDVLGSGEGIMGLADSYPPDFALADPAWLERVEQACVTWRWRLKGKAQRLAQMHGDFHPFNVLFGDDDALWLLDRSRGAWGEPADDVTCMAINYLFFSLQRSGALEPPFAELWDAFWNTYLDLTRDEELVTMVAPFFAWRALVVASPVWYTIADEVRAALFRFVDNVLAAPAFDPERANAYLHG
jgi:aminoglycoside phosphotransferase (APT) family kinase protein